MLAANTWYHIVVVADRDTSTKIYINGVDDTASFTLSTLALDYAGAPLDIGRFSGGSLYLDGLMDEVAIMKTALSPAQVSALYAAALDEEVTATAPEITEGDSIAVTMDEDGSPTAFSLTLNATDPTGQELTWSIHSQGAHGTASASGTGTSKAIGYTPVADYNGGDSFVVKVTDTDLESDTITVNVTINPVNDAPTVTGSPGVTMVKNGVHTFAAGEFNFDDVDGDSLGKIKVTSLETAGDLKYNGSDVTVPLEIDAANIGLLTFTPAADAVGTPTYATFGFTVFDDVGTPLESAPATMNIEVLVPSYRDVVLADSPANYWPMNETYGGGSGLIGSIYNYASGSPVEEDAAPATLRGYYDFGNADQSDIGAIGMRPPSYPGFDTDNLCAWFDGVNDYVFMNDKASLDITGALTMELWVNPDDTVGTQYLVSKFQTTSTDPQYRAYALGMIGGAIKFSISPDGVPANVKELTSTSTLTAGQWTHVAAVFAPDDSMRIYFNGVQVGELTEAVEGVPSQINNATAALRIGYFRAGGNQDFYDGRLDEVALYASALSAAQVLAHYNAAVTASSTAPEITEGDSTAVTMDEDGSPTAFSLTLNATDPTGQTLTWSIHSQGAHGTASIVTDPPTGPTVLIGYTPDADYNGSDLFVVKVTDTDLETDTITVNVTINPVNDAPTVTGSPSVTMFKNGVHTFAAGEFNFYDVDGDSLGKVKVTSLETAGDLEYDSGTWDDVTLNQEISAADISSGKLRFTPAADEFGTPTYATFGFTVFDDVGTPLESAPATMNIEVKDATLVETGLSIHYRADNVDGAGNPGNGSTVTLVNLANPSTHDGTLVNGSGIVLNGAQSGTPYEYGIPLTAANETHIQANTFTVQGGVNKVTAATWEFWLRADNWINQNRGALYGEFESSGTQTRHYLRLLGIGTATRTGHYDEFSGDGSSAESDSQWFNTSEFTQLVVTKSGNTMTFYKNGSQVGGTKTQSETWTGTGPITQTLFGKREGQNESFDGQFCIIRVYDAVLTPAQVLANYNAEPLSFGAATGTIFILR